MNNIDLALLSADEIKKNIDSMSVDFISRQAPRLPRDQLSILIIALADPSVAKPLEKLNAVIYALDDAHTLESAGQVMSLAQAKHVLAEALQSKQMQAKLLPLLVGMPHPVFSEFMKVADDRLLQALKLESSSEPVQHHITILQHELDKTLMDTESEIASLELEVKALDLEALSRLELERLAEGIQNLANRYNEALKKSENALAVAWNSGRSELIERLSQTKEAYQRSLRTEIGHPRSHEEKATGLYSLLESRLEDIYGNPNNPDDLEAIRDDEPAIEALTKLSIWYLKDYWELGLLPEVHDVSALDLDPSRHTELERVEHRDTLFKEVERNLAAKGIRNTKDLKQHFIVSRKLLQDYISTPWIYFPIFER